jgi:hypothetical protein
MFYLMDLCIKFGGIRATHNLVEKGKKGNVVKKGGEHA